MHLALLLSFFTHFFMSIQRIAYRMTRAGSLGNLRLVEEPLSEPRENEICVDVRAIGLNFADIFAMMGLYSATPKGSFVPGLEYAGVVHSTGAGVTRFAPGDAVMGAIRFGAYTNRLLIDERHAVALPLGWSFEEGAAFLVHGLTAYYALKPLGALREGATTLIHSAAGGVGIMANRIAKKFHAYTIGSVGTESKLPLLRAEGYDVGYVRSPGASYKAAARDIDRALAGRPLHLILDSLGGNVLQAGYDALAPAGRAVVFGSASMAFQGKRPPYLSLAWKWLKRPKFDALQMIEQNKSVLGFNLIWLWDNVDEMTHLLDELRALDLPQPFVGHIFSFEELPEAIRVFQSGLTTGKVVVRV
jgi:alcohol dehydrogenase